MHVYESPYSKEVYGGREPEKYLFVHNYSEIDSIINHVYGLVFYVLLLSPFYMYYVYDLYNK